MSTLAVVEEVLRTIGEPMSVREIVERAGDALPTKSKTPDTVVARDLSVDIKKKGEASLFARTAPGRYTMREIALRMQREQQQAAVASSEAPAPAPVLAPVPAPVPAPEAPVASVTPATTPVAPQAVPAPAPAEERPTNVLSSVMSQDRAAVIGVRPGAGVESTQSTASS